MIWRIRERAAFAELGQHGRRTRAGALWCRYLLDSSAHPPRVAFAIGRSYGPAVARNRLRRQLRALLAGNPPPPGHYLIGVTAQAKPPINELKFDIEQLLTKLADGARPRSG